MVQLVKKLRFSLAGLLLAVACISIVMAIYRYLNPAPVYPINTTGGLDRYSYAFGKQYGSEIAETDLLQAPTWDRRIPNPPLSANDAMVRADRVRKRLIKERKLLDNVRDGEWALEDVQLTPYGEDHWYWVVRFVYDMSQSGPPNELELVVLMDGTVVEPKIKKE